MNWATSLLDRLYTSYWIRDGVGKALPGLILLVAAAFSPTNAQPVLFLFGQVTPSGWVVLIVLSLAAGFGLQAFGELSGWARLYPDGPSRSPDARARDIRRALALGRAGEEAAERQRERYLAIKELSANLSLSLVVGLFLVATSYLPSPLPLAGRVLVILALIGSLYWYQRVIAVDQAALEVEAAGKPASRRSPARRSTRSR